MSEHLEQADQDKQDAAVRRLVGISALRRLREMVDEDQTLEANKARRVRIFLIWFLIALAVGLGFVLRHLNFA